MTKRQQIQANAEAFVREAVSLDFKQPVDKVKVATIARRISKVIPDSRGKAADSYNREHEMVAAE